jgi:hypothetical protein
MCLSGSAAPRWVAGRARSRVARGGGLLVDHADRGGTSPGMGDRSASLTPTPVSASHTPRIGMGSMYGTTRAREQLAMWPSRASERPVAPPWLCRTGAIPATARRKGLPDSPRRRTDAQWRRCLVQGGDSPQHAIDPVSIPHDVGNRGEATGIDRKVNPQVNTPFRPPQQVTDSVRSTLSRWRHGFEPRWDYGSDLQERVQS